MRRNCRFIEQFRAVDFAASFARQVKQTLGLLGIPAAVGMACTGAGGKAGHDLRVDSCGKCHGTAPLVARKHLVEARRRRRDDLSRGGQIGTVRPGPGNAYIGGAKLTGHGDKASISQIRRRAHAIHFTLWPVIGRPEPAAGHFDHFYIVRQKAFVDRGDPRQRRQAVRWLPQGNAGGQRQRQCANEQDIPKFDSSHLHALLSVAAHSIAASSSFTWLGSTYVSGLWPIAE